MTSTFVYWADLLHPAPLPETRYEDARGTLEVEAPEIGMRWLVRSTGAEASFVAALADRVGLDEFASDDPVLPAGVEPDPTRERVLLPWFVKRRLMGCSADHHYQFDAEFSPREGGRIGRREIRARVLRAFDEARGARPTLVWHTASASSPAASSGCGLPRGGQRSRSAARWNRRGAPAPAWWTATTGSRPGCGGGERLRPAHPSRAWTPCW
ncbi:hypothetical protein K7G98_14640 [Saccharothrix sp. MB29]|nr:hypothetical protein [Saccharothrix sp. MB29]